MASIDSDPALQSFLRVLESRKVMIEADRARKVSALSALRTIQLGELANQEERNLRGVNDEFESRGLFRSGGRLEDRADVVQQINEGRARSEFDLAEGSSEANRFATSQLASLSQQRASEEISARARLADREFQMASQARAERLAQEERERWEAEQSRLQSLYNSAASAGTVPYQGFTTAPSVRTSTAAVPDHPSSIKLRPRTVVALPTQQVTGPR